MKWIKIGGKKFLVDVCPNPRFERDDEPEERTQMFGGGSIPDDDAYISEREPSADDICNAVGSRGRHLFR